MIVARKSLQKAVQEATNDTLTKQMKLVRKRPRRNAAMKNLLSNPV